MNNFQQNFVRQNVTHFHARWEGVGVPQSVRGKMRPETPNPMLALTKDDEEVVLCLPETHRLM